MAIGARRRDRGGLSAWPGYVDALSTLLMVIIFVLLVFVLAQGFLGAALSSRDRALDQLHRQVAELAELLNLERGQVSELRGSLARTQQELRDAAAARDRLVQDLRGAEQARDQAGSERDAARGERDTALARIADLELATRGAAERLSGLETRLAEANTRVERTGEDTARTAQRLTETGRALEAERNARTQAERRGTELTRSLETERNARTQAEARVAEATRALQAERTARTQAEGRTAELTRNLDTERNARSQAETRLADLTKQLAEAQRQLTAMRAEIASLNQTVKADRETIEAKLADLTRLTEQVRALTALRDQLEHQVRDKDTARQQAEAQVQEATRLGDSARAQVALLTRQVEELRGQLARISAALDLAEQQGRDKDAQIVNLGNRLNTALAAQVERLQGYRSDFFGKLREIVGNRPDIRVVGDRFVFQSEVLFPRGSADLTEQGQQQIHDVAKVLRDLASQIPADVNWILRVDGHADRTPIRNQRFANNWELSAARAIAVAQMLVQEGLPANRVAAVAFGDTQPLDPADTPEAYARNRRIEFRLTDR